MPYRNGWNDIGELRNKAIGFHKLWAHQLDGMPKFLKLPRPVLSAATRLHPDEAWRQLCDRVP